MKDLCWWFFISSRFVFRQLIFSFYPDLFIFSPFTERQTRTGREVFVVNHAVSEVSHLMPVSNRLAEDDKIKWEESGPPWTVLFKVLIFILQKIYIESFLNHCISTKIHGFIVTLLISYKYKTCDSQVFIAKKNKWKIWKNHVKSVRENRGKEMSRSSEVRAFYWLTMTHNNAPAIPRFEFSGVKKLKYS